MLYEECGDIVKDGKYNIICNQTNCMGVMGAGLAAQIAARWPAVNERNRTACHNRNPLGSILVVRVDKERFCVNLYGQYDYGRNPNKTYTDYNAFQKALNELAARLNGSIIPDKWKVCFPRGIGCGLAHGKWVVIRSMIEEFEKKIPQDVYIVSRCPKGEE